MFVRTMLAMSLSCIFAGTTFAASATEQPLNPQPVTDVAIQDPIDVAVQDPIDPLATEASAAQPAEVTITAQEQRDLYEASETLNDLQETEDQSADIGAAPSASPEPAATTANKGSWTLNGLNNADWYENIGKGQFPVYARAHVMLNNAHASPGAIDGTSGKNTLKAIASFQQMNGIKPTGTLTKETWDKLLQRQGSKPAFIEYTITAADLKTPLAKSIPSDYALQAKMPGLYYTRMSDMLAEKFHMDEDFLKKLNPGANFSKEGQKLLVANIRNEVPENIHLIVAHKGAKQLYLFNNKNQMIGSFPASIGNTSTPSPTGTYKITGVARNPHSNRRCDRSRSANRPPRGRSNPVCYSPAAGPLSARRLRCRRPAPLWPWRAAAPRARRAWCAPLSRRSCPYNGGRRRRGSCAPRRGSARNRSGR